MKTLLNQSIKILFCMAVLVTQPILATYNVTAQSTRKYDEFGFLDTDSEGARLDAFAEEMKKEPLSRGYIVGYNGSHFPFGRFLRRIYGDRNYFSEVRGLFAPDRMVVSFGGYREEFTTELWIVPKDAPPPKTTSPFSGIPDNIKEPLEFDHECMICEPVVFIDLPILKEGLQYYADALIRNANTRALIEMCSAGFVNPRESLRVLTRARTLLVKKYQINPKRINTRLLRACKFADLQFWILPNGKN